MSSYAPEPADFTAELDRAMSGYLGRLSGETVSGTERDVTVTVRLDGGVESVDIPTRLLNRFTGPALSQIVVGAIAAAVGEAAKRRAEIEEQVSILDESVLELAEQMERDPVETALRLSRPR